MVTVNSIMSNLYIDGVSARSLQAQSQDEEPSRIIVPSRTRDYSYWLRIGNVRQILAKNGQEPTTPSKDQLEKVPTLTWTPSARPPVIPDYMVSGKPVGVIWAPGESAKLTVYKEEKRLAKGTTEVPVDVEVTKEEFEQMLREKFGEGAKFYNIHKKGDVWFSAVYDPNTRRIVWVTTPTNILKSLGEKTLTAQVTESLKEQGVKPEDVKIVQKDGQVYAKVTGLFPEVVTGEVLSFSPALMPRIESPQRVQPPSVSGKTISEEISGMPINLGLVPSPPKVSERREGVRGKFEGYEKYYEGLYVTRNLLGLSRTEYIENPAIRHRVHGVSFPRYKLVDHEIRKEGFEPVTVRIPGEVISAIEELGAPAVATMPSKKYESVSATLGKGETPFFLQQMLIKSLGLENRPFTGTPKAGWTDVERWKWATREVGKDLLQGAIGVITFPVDVPLLFIQRKKIDWSQAVPGIMQSIKTGELGAEILGGILFGAGASALISKAGLVTRVSPTKPRVGTVIKQSAKRGIKTVSDDVARSVSFVGDDLTRSMSQVSDDLVRGSFRRSLFTEEDVQWFKKALPDKWFPLYKKGPSIPKTKLTQLSVLKDIEMLEHPKFTLPQRPTYVNFKWGNIAIQGDDVQMAIKVGGRQGRIVATKGEVFVEGELWKHPNLVKQAMQELAIRDPTQWANFRRAMTRMSGRVVDLLKGKGSWKDLVGAKAKYIVRETAEGTKGPRIMDLTKVDFRKVGPVYLTSPIEVSPATPIVTALATFFAESGGLIRPLQIPESVLRSLSKRKISEKGIDITFLTRPGLDVTSGFRQEFVPKIKVRTELRPSIERKIKLELEPSLRELSIITPLYMTSPIQGQVQPYKQLFQTAVASAGATPSITALGFVGKFRGALKSQAVSTAPPIPPRGGLGRETPPFFPRVAIPKVWMVPVGVELLGEIPRRRPKKTPKKAKKKIKPKKPKTEKPKKRREVSVTKKVVARGLFPRNVFSVGLGK